MATNKYITIRDSVSYKSKRFHVMFEGYLPSLDKSVDIKKAVNGGYDISVGATYEEHSFIIRCRGEDPNTDFGNIDDLEWFYRLSDPNPSSGSPSNVLTMTDHFGLDHNVMMVGKFSRQSLTTIIEGQSSYFLAPVTMLFMVSA